MKPKILLLFIPLLLCIGVIVLQKIIRIEYTNHDDLLQSFIRSRYQEIAKNINASRVIPMLPLYQRRQIQEETDLINDALGTNNNRNFEILVQIQALNRDPIILWRNNADPDTYSISSTEFDDKGRIKVRSDSQNVHDHYVVNSIKMGIERLKSITKIRIPEEKCIRSIAYIILRKKDPRLYPALENLYTILMTRHDKLISTDMSCLDVLVLIWNRIYHKINRGYRKNLIDSFIKELADGRKECISGIFDRIVDTLNIVDPEIVIKPEWVIQRELQDKTGIFRKEFLEVRPEMKEAVNSVDLSEEQKELSKQFESQFTLFLQSQFKKDYVDTNIMSQADLDKELSRWVDACY